MSDLPVIAVRSPSDLMALVPYLIGYQPTDTVAVVYLGGPNGVAVATHPLYGAPEETLIPEVMVARLHAKIGRADATAVLIAAYGPLSDRPLLVRLVAALAETVPVKAAYLADGGRCYCLTCDCPAAVAGIAFDASASAAACEATVAGLVAFPSREHVLALADPQPQLQARTAARLATTLMPADPIAAFDELRDQAEHGATADAGLAATIAVLLTDPGVRDRALLGVNENGWQRDWWLSLVRQTPDGYLAPAGRIAAFCCWLRGENSLAAAILQRVLAAHPDDSTAAAMAGCVLAGMTVSEALGSWPPAATVPGVAR